MGNSFVGRPPWLKTGCLILDIHKRADGRAKLEQKFNVVRMIFNDPKYEGVFARKL
jgi:hypothetical protein